MSSSVEAPPNQDPLTNEEGTAIIQNWLNQRLRITISDSRSFEGWFKCVDRDTNIVLSGAEEFREGCCFPSRFYASGPLNSRPATIHRSNCGSGETCHKSGLNTSSTSPFTVHITNSKYQHTTQSPLLMSTANHANQMSLEKYPYKSYIQIL